MPGEAVAAFDRALALQGHWTIDPAAFDGHVPRRTDR